MRKAARPALVLVAVLATCSPPGTWAGADPDGMPPFELQNWDGRVVSNESQKGRTTLVAFTFAKCIFACPMITFRLQELDTTMGHPEDVDYLHVSVNPEDDTAEEILLHFEKHDLDPRTDPRWLFANGPADKLDHVLETAGIDVQRRDVEGGFLIEHTIRVLVLAPDGSTSASFDTYHFKEEEMIDAIRSARQAQ